ncbi:A-kinase anchor protein 17A [Lepus europaeus]|uniref:A-kinase anchor protein 17A n=1 Tax=Lepus europaeus TaxID=9983 RepID=UPI002B493F8F|nr:A-kinase anchor protein 17A [Lepus europaeus]
MAAATIVHDTSEAVELCAALGLFLQPVAKMSISVALPEGAWPGKAISNWEVMERLKAMVPSPPFSALRIAKSTLDFVRFEGELENRALAGAVRARLDGRAIRLSGFPEALRVRAAEARADGPAPGEWEEALPGERPDTLHLQGLPCRWFAERPAASGGGAAASGGGTVASGGGTAASGGGTATSGGASSTSGGGNPASGSGGPTSGTPGASDRPSEQVLARVFAAFGEVRRVDIPMLDPYRADAAGRGAHAFSAAGQLHFEAFVQYREYPGFLRAMRALRGTKLMYKGEDGKAVACSIKVSCDATRHLSDAAIRKRQLERQKLQELERQREQQKRREREAEERRRAEERRQKEAAARERARRREEKRARRERRRRRRAARAEAEAQAQAQAQAQQRLRDEVRTEERRLLLAQRNLESLRLVAALLGRAKAAQERKGALARRRRQEAELRRVEAEQRRALGLQRRERELRLRLLGALLGRRPTPPEDSKDADGAGAGGRLLGPVLDALRRLGATPSAGSGRGPGDENGSVPVDSGSGREEIRNDRGSQDQTGSGPGEAGSGRDSTGTGQVLTVETGSGSGEAGSGPKETGSGQGTQDQTGSATRDSSSGRGLCEEAGSGPRVTGSGQSSKDGVAESGPGGAEDGGRGRGLRDAGSGRNSREAPEAGRDPDGAGRGHGSDSGGGRGHGDDGDEARSRRGHRDDPGDSSPAHRRRRRSRSRGGRRECSRDSGGRHGRWRRPSPARRAERSRSPRSPGRRRSSRTR